MAAQDYSDLRRQVYAFYSLYYPAFNGLSRQTMMLLPSSLATFDLNSCIILYSSSNC